MVIKILIISGEFLPRLEDESDHVCGLCKKNYATLLNLERHECKALQNVECLEDLIVENVLFPYYCNFCGKGFDHFMEYRTHLVGHVGSKPFACAVCGERFNHPISLYGHHMNLHLEPEPKLDNSLLKQEVTSQKKNEELSWFCQNCETSFTTEAFYQDHRCLQSEEGLLSNVIECDLCCVTFPNVDSLKSHIITLHCVNTANICDECGQIFGKRWAMIKHKQIHVTKKSQTKVAANTTIEQEVICLSDKVGGSSSSNQNSLSVDGVGVLNKTIEDILVAAASIGTFQLDDNNVQNSTNNDAENLNKLDSLSTTNFPNAQNDDGSNITNNNKSDLPVVPVMQVLPDEQQSSFSSFDINNSTETESGVTCDRDTSINSNVTSGTANKGLLSQCLDDCANHVQQEPMQTLTVIDEGFAIDLTRAVESGTNNSGINSFSSSEGEISNENDKTKIKKPGPKRSKRSKFSKTINLVKSQELPSAVPRQGPNQCAKAKRQTEPNKCSKSNKQVEPSKHNNPLSPESANVDVEANVMETSTSHTSLNLKVTNATLPAPSIPINVTNIKDDIVTSISLSNTKEEVGIRKSKRQKANGIRKALLSMKSKRRKSLLLPGNEKGAKQDRLNLVEDTDKSFSSPQTVAISEHLNRENPTSVSKNKEKSVISNQTKLSFITCPICDEQFFNDSHGLQLHYEGHLKQCKVVVQNILLQIQF